MTTLQIRQEAAQAGFNILIRMNAVPRSIAACLGETFAAAAHSGSDLHSVRSADPTCAPSPQQTGNAPLLRTRKCRAKITGASGRCWRENGVRSGVKHDR